MEHMKHEDISHWKHETMKEHDGGHMNGSMNTEGMEKMNEPAHHMGGMTIINHQEHMETEMKSTMHHWPKVGEEHKR